MDANTKREIIAKVCYDSFTGLRPRTPQRPTGAKVFEAPVEFRKKLNYGDNAYIRMTNIGGLDEYLYHVELRKEGKLKYEVHVYGYEQDKMGKYRGQQYKEFEDMILKSEIFQKKSTRQINNHISEEVIQRLIELSRDS